jgi:broad specificity phosphatase PhoE
LSALPSSDSTWPTRLFLIRHGESAGNVARDAAEAAGLPLIELQGRDVDVPLSPLGERQARALGRWFATRPDTEQPTVVLASPYRRADQTAQLLVEQLSCKPRVRSIDERLREKEFGSLNRLTRAGIIARFPEEAALRAEIGKFYYRPPGGESWCDVILRLRSILDDLQLRHRRERVLIVAHQVIVLCFRYLLEQMNEQEILSIDRRADVANCSVTSYELVKGEADEALVLSAYNFVAPLEEAGEEVTKAPDPAAPR